MVAETQIEELLIKQGFSDFKWIDPHKIIVAQWVRVKCQFGCSDYGLGTCPPNTPSVQDCRTFFNEYSLAVIIELSLQADKNNYPTEWSKQTTQKLLELERQTFLSGFQKAFLLNQTCCSLCTDCSGTRLQCKNKKNARPSPESFAVDVYQTLQNQGIDISVVPDNPGQMKRVAILLVE